MEASQVEAFNQILPCPIAEEGNRVLGDDGNPHLDTGLNNESDMTVSAKFGFPEIFSRSIKDAGGLPIQRNDMNTFLNILSRQIAYFQMGGVVKWTNDIASSEFYGGYPPDAIVWYNDRQWQHVSGRMNTNRPGGNGNEDERVTGWKQIGPTAGTGTTSLDCQKLCPTIEQWRQLIDWNKTNAYKPDASKAVTGFLPEGHPDKGDDNGYMVQYGTEIKLKSSWWNWQTICFLVDTSKNAGTPDIQFAQVPSVYLWMGMNFRQANLSLGAKKLQNYKWGLDMMQRTGNFTSSDLYIDLSKTFDLYTFTLGGGGYVRGIYGTGDCSACRIDVNEDELGG